MTSNHTNQSNSHPWLRASALLGLAILVFLQLLITFRGLKSPDAMEQSVIARELARGEGLRTKVIRPYALRQQVEAGKPVELLSQQNTIQPPLPSFLLAPIFKTLENHWENASKARVYVLDRVVATLSLLFFIAAIGLTYLTVQRLFDDRIANWTVLIMAGCQLLWNVAITSLAPMILLFLFSACLFQIVLMHERSNDDRGGNAWLALGIGICFAGMVFTHWRALWLLPGLCAAAARLLKPRGLSTLIALPVIPLLIFWCLRNQEITDDFLGVTKSSFQSVFNAQSDEVAQRNYDIINPILNPKAVTRFFLHQALHQIQHLYGYLGEALPAILFFIALLHPFKRPETSGMRFGLSMMWLGAFLGMSFLGISHDDTHEKQLHHLFIPIFSAYGLAFLYVLWARLPIGQGMGWIPHHGIAIIAWFITIIPMLISLPDEINNGIRARGMQPQWPPYLPDSFALLRPTFQEDELLVADIPWATAWYSDRSSLWLPKDRSQYDQLQALAQEQNILIGGILLSPYSARASTSINDALQNQYADWSEHLYLAAQSWHNENNATINRQFPFREIVPLYGTIGLGGRILMEMILFTDTAHHQKLMRRSNTPSPENPNPPSETSDSSSESDSNQGNSSAH